MIFARRWGVLCGRALRGRRGDGMFPCRYFASFSKELDAQLASVSEDDNYRAASTTLRRVSWEKAFPEFSRFTNKQLSERLRTIRGKASRPWTYDEDSALLNNVRRFVKTEGRRETIKWRELAQSVQQLYDRDSRELQLRWKYWKSKKTREWTEQERVALVQIAEQCRNEKGHIVWKDVVKHGSQMFQGRNPLEAKIQYYGVKGRTKKGRANSVHRERHIQQQSPSSAPSEMSNLSNAALFSSVQQGEQCHAEESSPKAIASSNLKTITTAAMPSHSTLPPPPSSSPSAAITPKDILAHSSSKAMQLRALRFQINDDKEDGARGGMAHTGWRGIRQTGGDHEVGESFTSLHGLKQQVPALRSSSRKHIRRLFGEVVEAKN
eukprot:jgi/Bigna1/89595/estExt_fgenesh1_pg.C_520045